MADHPFTPEDIQFIKDKLKYSQKHLDQFLEHQDYQLFTVGEFRSFIIDDSSDYYDFDDADEHYSEDSVLSMTDEEVLAEANGDTEVVLPSNRVLRLYA